MPWLELQLTLTAAQEPPAEAALSDAGALSVTLLDADADTPDEAAVLEPSVGETPLWRAVSVLALFAPDADRGALLAAIRGALPGLPADHIAFREVSDKDWERAWMDRFHPMRFGRRLWIHPWNVEQPAGADDAVIVRLDPGLAFGTGTHPTTALCLEWLDGLELAGKSLMDYGCGSGVLAIAALKLGAARAIAIDNDAQALTATRENAVRNGVATRLLTHAPETLPADARADVLVANILAGPLAALAPRFASLCATGAPIALSGVLAAQVAELMARYRACGFTDLGVVRREGWVRITGRRA